MPNNSSLEAYIDKMKETNGNEERKVRLTKVFDANLELAGLVAFHRLSPGVVTEYIGFFKGLLNFSFRFKYDQGQDTIILFPKPWHVTTALWDVYLINEDRVLIHLSQNNTIPVPRL